MRGLTMQNNFPNNSRKTESTINSQATIKRVDLTDSVQRQLGLSKADSSQMVDQIFTLITDSLASGQNVKLANFGTFQLKDMASRTGRNPKTNEVVAIPARRAVTFKPSTKLSRRVVKARLKSKELEAQRHAQDKRELLKALGQKIGSPESELQFLFKAPSSAQIQNDVDIPDRRALIRQEN